MAADPYPETKKGLSTRMRVLVVLLSVGFAGTERHAIELTNALAAHCEVALLLRERPREPHRQAQYDALLRAIAPQVSIFRASRAIPVSGLWKAMHRFKPDLIHAHHERSARIASRYAGRVPVIATVHVHFRPRDFMRCAGLIFLTRDEQSSAARVYQGRSWIIGNWVVPSSRPDDARLSALRQEIGVTDSDYVIGTVARLEPVKGIDALIRAFQAAQLPASRLVIAGEGSQRAALQSLCDRLHLSRQAIFTGFRADVRDLYHCFDLFVLNSIDEPYGLAILEAAAAGVPVIASETAGARAIAEGMPIRLYPAGSVPALAAELQTAFASGRVSLPPPAGFALEDRLSAIMNAYRDVIALHAPSHRTRVPDAHPGPSDDRKEKYIA